MRREREREKDEIKLLLLTQFELAFCEAMTRGLKAVFVTTNKYILTIGQVQAF